MSALLIKVAKKQIQLSQLTKDINELAESLTLKKQTIRNLQSRVDDIASHQGNQLDISMHSAWLHYIADLDTQISLQKQTEASLISQFETLTAKQTKIVLNIKYLESQYQDTERHHLRLKSLKRDKQYNNSPEDRQYD
ncbi:hypothetical protein OE749_11465 [Aestuariibacter sp. AA17]|uniref:Flagellar FliJ protein n=1 Tax=Fluctibacter corallii TaxID=2984329 RepID=A0ABT3A9G1_9ALTE|nr:hypothetical protein [Aestuariibacter sp. AA17]MCV2885311.1 hypothetical protein [Aestuariibacter sp. AA17]